MSDATPSIAAFLDSVDAPERSLVTLNRTEPKPVQNLLELAFDGQTVTVGESMLPEEAANLVLLVEDGEVVAVSPLEAVMDAFLLVNADLYRTGLSGLDKYEAPEVLTRLDETVFRLRGYPASNKEKLLLIVMSRYIERRAWVVGSGTLRSTFQRLSRIEDERGTRAVYERLSDTDVEVHVYGVPDWEPPASLGVRLHTGTSADYRKSWCVVFVPEDDADAHAALVAVEVGRNEWRGMWTYRRDRVLAIQDYLVGHF
jgi:hypothetical protein